MAHGLSWISYRIPKTVTIEPNFVGTSQFVTSASQRIEFANTFTNGGYTENFQKSTIENNYLTSKSILISGQAIGASVLPGGSISYGEAKDFLQSGVSYTSKTENLTIVAEYNQNNDVVESINYTITAPLLTVNIQSSAISLRSGFITTTTTTEAFSEKITTSIENLKPTITYIETTVTSARSTRISTNLQVTVTSTSGTSAFKTFSSPQKNQVVVYDTVWLKINNPFQSQTSNAVLASNAQNNTDFSGINELDFISDQTTISWNHPVFVPEPWVTSYFDFEAITSNSSRTTFSTYTTHVTRFKASSITFSVENWVTYTTSESQSNQTKTTTSFSLYENIDWSATTLIDTSSTSSSSTFSQTFTTTINNHEITYTTSTFDVQIKAPLSFLNSTGGFFINRSILPWGLKNGFHTSEAKSLVTESSQFSTTTSKTSYRFTLQSSVTNTFSDQAATGAQNQYTLISGNWFQTKNIDLGADNSLQESAFATAQPGFNFLRAGAPNLNFTTTPSRQSGPLILTMSGNEHTLFISDFESNIASEIPGYLVPLFYLTFNTILNKAPHGGGLHPSAWSTMSISRKGENFSSTWRFEENRNESDTTYSTSSGTCKLLTESDFPLGAEIINWRTLGGAMQPNTNIVVFNKQGVMEVITYNGSASGSEISTQDSFGYTTTLAGENITLRREIPRIAGYGVTQFPLIDNGMP